MKHFTNGLLIDVMELPGTRSNSLLRCLLRWILYRSRISTERWKFYNLISIEIFTKIMRRLICTICANLNTSWRTLNNRRLRTQYLHFNEVIWSYLHCLYIRVHMWSVCLYFIDVICSNVEYHLLIYVLCSFRNARIPLDDDTCWVKILIIQLWALWYFWNIVPQSVKLYRNLYSNF